MADGVHAHHTYLLTYLLTYVVYGVKSELRYTHGLLACGRVWHYFNDTDIKNRYMLVFLVITLKSLLGNRNCTCFAFRHID